ncbi:MAG: alpha/beta hydrolase [Bdellovibrionota bacterium]
MAKRIRLPNHKNAQRVLLVAGSAVSAILLYWLGSLLFPLQSAELSGRIELWRGGVREIDLGGLHGYVQDQCEKEGGETKTHCNCVALIHGLGDNALTFKRVLLVPPKGWTQLLVGESNERLKIYALDLPGAGQSPAPMVLSDYRARNLAARLKKSLASECRAWVVAGNSLGGWVASWLALDWREGVSKLVLLDSGGLKIQAKADTQAFTEPTVESLKELQRKLYFRPRPHPDYFWRAAMERMKTSTSRDVLSAQVDADRLDDKLPALRLPTIIVWGQNDGLLPRETGQIFHSLVRGSIYREIPECGHLPQKECPLAVVSALADAIRLGSM